MYYHRNEAGEMLRQAQHDGLGLCTLLFTELSRSEKSAIGTSEAAGISLFCIRL
jgi:hypothetical protein